VVIYKFNENKKNNSTIILDKAGKEKFKRLLSYNAKHQKKFIKMKN